MAIISGYNQGVDKRAGRGDYQSPAAGREADGLASL